MRELRRCSLAIAALLAPLLIAPPPAAADEKRDPAPIIDPIPEDPAPSGLGLVLKEVAQLPESTPTPPPTDDRLARHNRINGLGALPDGSGRLYVPDLNGKLYLIDKETGASHSYLDVGATFEPDFFNSAGLGQGLAFAAFHPDFAENGKFYTAHVEAGEALETEEPDLPPQPDAEYHGVVTEWIADDPSADTFSGTHREMLRTGFSGRIHNLQQIGFNPNAESGDTDYGNLYIAVGDGGNGNVDPDLNDPQDLSVPQGKILRIDVSGHNSSNGEYGIPSGNPFAGQEGKLGEIYAYGMRDPHRFSWDTGGSQRMFLAHIGEHSIESIHQISPGSNIGWPEREGRFTFRKDDRCHLYPLPPDDEEYDYEYPLAAYDHDPPPDWDCRSDVGRAIAGGFVYRGDNVSELRGKYVFGDMVDGRLFYTEESQMRRGSTGSERAQIYELSAYTTSGAPVTMQDLAGDERIDLRIGQDAEGEPYLLSKANGKVWKVVDTKRFASGDDGDVRIDGATKAGHWTPVTPSKWEFDHGQVILAEAGEKRPGPSRPYEYAVLKKGPRFASSQFDAQVRLDTPVSEKNRDTILIFGHRDDTHFYYTHLSSDNTSYGHNGVFLVNGDDRVRIDRQWNANRSQGAPPAITDDGWHDVRVRHRSDTGEIAVYVDDMDRPVFTALDTTLDSGRVGFGSFDNVGRLRGLTVRGTPAR